MTRVEESVRERVRIRFAIEGDVIRGVFMVAQLPCSKPVGIAKGSDYMGEAQDQKSTRSSRISRRSSDAVGAPW